MPYASKTEVSVDKSRMEIERMLVKHGADRFAFFIEPISAVIVFDYNGLRIKFVLPLPEAPSTARGQNQFEQAKRSRWRALLLCLKAKLEAVESNIETFQEAFLAHVMTPDNRTVYEHVTPRLKQIAEGKEMGKVPLLPAPGGGV